MLELVGYSDYICPYCYIGGAIMEDVLEAYDASLEWRGFEIHPEIPADGMPIEALNPGLLNGLKATVSTIAERHRVPIQLPSRLANSRGALLGAEFARDHGLQSAYHHAVFRAYFVDDRDIGQLPVLQEIATDVGLEAEAFGRAVHDRVAEPRLRETAEYCHRTGITGVPTWIAQGRYSIVGALPPGHMRKSLDWVLDHIANEPDAG